MNCFSDESRRSQNDLVSFIVPIYNMEQSLGKCIDSILNQSMKQIELILIDDGSKDKSGLICDEYAKKDKRIVVIHKDNGGIADATNIGLNHATGKFILFVDSDDFIEPDMAEKMVDTHHRTGADIVQCGMTIQSVNGTIIRKANRKKNTFEGPLNILESYFLWKGIGGNLAAKLIKANLFEGLRMPKGRMFADVSILPSLLKRCNRYEIIEDGFYHVVSNPQSISRGEINDRIYKDIIYNLDTVCKFIDENCPSLLYHTYYVKASTVAYYYERIKHSNNLYDVDEKLKALSYLFKHNYKKLKKSRMFYKYPLVRRMQLFLFNVNPYISIYAEKIYRIFKAQ